MYVCVCVHAHAHMYVCMCVYMCRCKRVCVCVCVCVCAWLYARKLTDVHCTDTDIVHTPHVGTLSMYTTIVFDTMKCIYYCLLLQYYFSTSTGMTP